MPAWKKRFFIVFCVFSAMLLTGTEAAYAASPSDLFFMKVFGVGSGRVEVHSATVASGYGSGQHSVTYFSPADVMDHGCGNTRGTGLQMVGPNLFFLKCYDTPGGHVEVHSATAASGYASGQHNATYFSTADVNGNQCNGIFPFDGVQMVGSTLFYLKCFNVDSGHIEVHSATAGSGYTGGQHNATYISAADSTNGSFMMVGADLFFIKTFNTPSGRVEVHSATAASGYTSGQHNVTYFSAADAANGNFMMVGHDLFFVKAQRTGSGRVEVHSATAASGYATGQHSVTYILPADNSNGDFQMSGS